MTETDDWGPWWRECPGTVALAAILPVLLLILERTGPEDALLETIAISATVSTAMLVIGRLEVAERRMREVGNLEEGPR